MTDSKINIAELVRRGLDRCEGERQRAQDALRRVDGWRADRLDRVAALFEREARWWNVLTRVAYVKHGAPEVFGRATIYAEHRALDFARSYRDYAGRARSSAAQRDARGVA